MRSSERTGTPLKGHQQAQAVWVDLAAVFCRHEAAATGIVIDQPVAGGLSRWLRTADGGWVGVVTYVAALRASERAICCAS
jgi:hypothetical protein